MPHSIQNSLVIVPLHPTFAAEVKGLDFNHVTDDVFADVYEAITKYGILVFRATGLDDAGHVAFARRFGELDDVKPYSKAGKKHRLAFDELFDVSNLMEDGSIAPLDSQRHAFNKGNSLFHVDSSFNPRRGSYSILRAHELPPAGTGGATEFADTRTAFADLPAALRADLVAKDYVACHNLMHSRRTAAPDVLGHLDPAHAFMSRHRLVQRHEPSGRMNLYVASHAHHVEGLPEEESAALLARLYAHAQQERYVVSVPWLNNGDVVMWDNTCVMHRATGGSYEGKFKRDMRRATVHDGSSTAWGLNEQTDDRQGYP